uniref:Uncharacterized protein n=1 Tax=Leptocylindrus danicus TaxID=163516 RepID=A0A6U2SA18_9STRA|mmetsp:Transcript_6234/g.9153  ORF Transcript_6234/g.9153 Transcript_6234/m.9153 type:complete len:257 (+) Transcript_6234:155-925(+)
MKHLNVYWVLATSLGLWFLFLHSPPILSERKVLYWNNENHTLETNDAPFLLHLIGSYLIYLICMLNTLYTPSCSTLTLIGGTAAVKARSVHVWMGRCAMIAGYLSFALGVYIACWGQLVAILTTVVGIIHMIWQITGHYAICEYRRLKQLVHSLEHRGDDEQSQPSSVGELEDAKIKMHKALYTHIIRMLAIFVVSHGAIAGVFLSRVLSRGNGIAYYIIMNLVFVSLLIMHYRMYRHFVHQNELEQREAGENETD